MNEHPQLHDELRQPAPAPAPAPETPVDAGSQALAEALRSSFGIVKLVMIALVLVFLGSGIFKVGPGERAIKLRMGKVVGQGEAALLKEGLHWSFPYPFESYEKVSVTGSKKANSSVGWYYTTPEQELANTEPPPGATLNPAQDGYVLSADGNILHVRATLTYHIADPVRYVFNFVNASNIIQSAVDNAVLYAAAGFNVDDILYRDVFSFQDAVRKRAAALLEKHDLGIVVEQCVVEKSIPPRQLKDAFKSVQDADLNRNTLLNKARGYENQVTNQAWANAASLVNAARYESRSMVSEIAARADEFQKLLPRYRENPDLFCQKRLNETLGRVFTNAQDKIYVAEGSRELRLLLNRELPKPKEEPTP